MNAAYIHEDVMKFTIWRWHFTSNWTSCELIYVHVYTSTQYIYIYTAYTYGLEWNGLLRASLMNPILSTGTAECYALQVSLHPQTCTILGRPGNPCSLGQPLGLVLV